MQGLELLSWFHLRQRPFGSSEGTYFFLKWVHCRYRPSLNRNFCPLSQLGNDSRAAVGGNRKPRMSNPSKTEDVKTTLNRIRRNYAQNPLYVWLFSASSLALIPKSYHRYPGTPVLWSIPLCAGLAGYGGYGTLLGDSLNGAGITSAWSLAYFLINSRRCFRLRAPHGLSLAVVSLAGINAFVYGSYYFLDADTARRNEV